MRSAQLFSTVILFAALGCGGASSSSGVDQPIRVRHAQLRSGPLPGALPIDGSVNDGPHTTSETVGASYAVALGSQAVTIRGRASTNAVAVAIAFLDLGDAHWVFPVGAPDLANGGEYQWSVVADFGRDIPPGLHTLGFAAIDASGNAGIQRTWELCFVPDVPENGYTCQAANVDGGVALPKSVISLSWNTQVDLDLVIVTPEGKVVSAKAPSTASVDGGTIPDSTLLDPTVGHLTRDSNPGCALDGRRLESLVFDGTPPPGTYRVYARFFSACAQNSVAYSLDVYRPSAGGTSLERTSEYRGQLLALQANGGSTLGTLVTEITFP